MTQNKQPVEAIAIGVGTRGRDAYGAYALENPSRLKFIAVADLDETKRTIFQELHNIPDKLVFSHWTELLNSERGKIAPVAFICTPDQMHYEPAMKALNLDYHLFLEKPIAPTLNECLEIAKLAEEKNKIVQVAHVLRFTEFFKTIKNFLNTKKLGKIIHYEHSENVAYWHFGHSFVRGPYKNKATSTPIVLAKTCHDLDIIYWLLNEKPTDVYSHGELTHYRKENAPKGSPERCTDGCPIAEECPWFAPRLYIELEPIIRTAQYSPSKFLKWMTKRIIKSKSFRNFIALFNKDVRKIKYWDQFPVTHITQDYSIAGRIKALKEGQYGLCIYKCGNDVPDHQVSTFNFPSGTTATLTMHGLSEHEGRELRIFGSRGVLRGHFRNSSELIQFTDFRNGEIKTLRSTGLNTETHSGADENIMHAFTAVMLGEKTRKEGNLTDIFSAMESHFMGFAAESSRITKEKKEMEDFRRN